MYLQGIKFESTASLHEKEKLVGYQAEEKKINISCNKLGNRVIQHSWDASKSPSPKILFELLDMYIINQVFYSCIGWICSPFSSANLLSCPMFFYPGSDKCIMHIMFFFQFD